MERLKNDKYKEYYAHISEGNKETLFEHTNLVSQYFEKLIKVHNLEVVIDNLISEIIKSYPEKDKNYSRNFIRTIFFAIPEFHDIGKINPNFQYNKMKNEKFNRLELSFGSDHSKIGAFLFIQNFIMQANDKVNSGNAKLLNLFILFALSWTISKHHSPRIEYANEYQFDERFIDDIFKFVKNDMLLNFNKGDQVKIAKKFNFEILKNVKSLLVENEFAIFALMKLSYSLLTASDYLATTHFMNGWDKMFDDFGTLDNKLRHKIVGNIKISKSYNKKIYKELENYKFEFPEKESNNNLNKLRQNLAVEIINNINNNSDKNLFYIEAPTGSGKTNLSMLALAELLKNDIKSNDITKIFYVFPFTTLITQTFKTVKETLGLNDDEIVQIHSKTGFFQRGNDDKYGKERLNIIDYQFVNYPISLMSHVKFFEVLKSNKKSANYLLHRLANSIVIIDELQAYPPKEWDKVVYFINNYSKNFNIKFILMSATLPKIDKLILSQKEEFVFLVKDKNKYFQNPNFKNRVEFDFSMLNNSDFNKDEREDFLDKLWFKILDESKRYRKSSNIKKVHTIVEFIFKKTATDFVNSIKSKDENGFFDEIFLISGTILEPRRKEVINKIKSNEFKDKNILVVTTQVIEAGVDIDMDIGFKDSSIADSDEQLAGRINRNINKPMCKLFIFDLDDGKVIYRNDYRFKLLETSQKEEYFEILKKKDFDILYNLVINHRNKFNEQLGFADNLIAYIDNIKNLDLDLIDKDFRLINDSFQTVSVFVPLKISIRISSSDEQNFTEKELKFLQEKKKYSGESEVDGEKVWELYCDIIENKEKDFVQNKIQRIILQGIMSKFTFSTGYYSKDIQNIIESGNCEEKYGFYKLMNVDDVYDYKTGIKDLKFEDIYFW